MGRSSQYNHYIQRLDARGNVTDPQWIDIEEEFPGLLYEKATGLNDIGNTKNIYTEEYADSDRKRVYLPGDMDHDVSLIANEGTTINMTFLVVGDALSRQQIIERFESEIRTGIHRYRDDARHREFDFIVQNEIKVSDERWHGTTPYVEIEVPMQNLNGKTRDVSLQYAQ